MRDVPRFSLKRLLVAFTLVAVGIWMVWVVPQYERQGGKLALCAMLWFGGGALVGVGLLAPFRRPWFGGVFGVAAVGLLFCLITLEFVAW